MGFGEKTDSSDRLHRVVSPREVSVSENLAWRATMRQGESQPPVQHHLSEIEIGCGSCGRTWTARVGHLGIGQLRYTENGWQSQCPYCKAVNAYNIR
jgi:hypothetical protein